MGLPSLSSNEINRGHLHGYRLAVAHFKLQLAAAAYDLLGRNAIDLLRPRAHELDSAARDDEGFEIVGAKVGEQFEHRLIDHLGERAPGLRILRRCDPVLHGLIEFRGRHPGVRSCDDFDDAALAACQGGFQIALEQRSKGFFVLPLRVLRREHLHAVEREEDLGIRRARWFIRIQRANRLRLLAKRHRRMQRSSFGQEGEEGGLSLCADRKGFLS